MVRYTLLHREQLVLLLVILWIKGVGVTTAMNGSWVCGINARIALPIQRLTIWSVIPLVKVSR